ncbi:type II toxin-antitoxin system death-on-curing family toxin [Staphylococcus pseudintermedius]|nr:type II toxin-antitoxin system death-on-curing family toxin [Staphylococcus pseudintermedius]EIO0081871.1 type II toxin-antitoxin system death-on-curing family toxin [Staphylococcus pseudintermedius]
MTKYLTEKDLILLNTHIIEIYSPDEPIGVAQPTALNMTVESPKQEIFGEVLYPTLELKAANLFRNLVMKHVFQNANKRTAFAALQIFLDDNGKWINVDNNEATEFTVGVVTERLEEEEIARWIKKNWIDL